MNQGLQAAATPDPPGAWPEGPRPQAACVPAAITTVGATRPPDPRTPVPAVLPVTKPGCEALARGPDRSFNYNLWGKNPPLLELLGRLPV